MISSKRPRSSSRPSQSPRPRHRKHVSALATSPSSARPLRCADGLSDVATSGNTGPAFIPHAVKMNVDAAPVLVSIDKRNGTFIDGTIYSLR
ncbi:hypothetical protein A0H81_14744 [Grifola frondosa]|uniref:Uncharacterized protein n=1 Tax=Grifola frondosa TaxID=5627 RepID=A0A1C7LMT8_GRIFR|nr:hypothetical protein A0H81_14744 [Grifola frondosa]